MNKKYYSINNKEAFPRTLCNTIAKFQDIGKKNLTNKMAELKLVNGIYVRCIY